MMTSKLQVEEMNNFIITKSASSQVVDKIETLKRENKKYQMRIKELEDFKKIMGQTLHDLQSPLASLQILSDSINELPEHKRITLRSATIGATDIMNNALQHYKPSKNTQTANNQRQVALASIIIAEIINDKCFRYKDLPIKINFDLTALNAFLCIKVIPSELKRALSNLINNAVESLAHDGGEITLKLRANDEWVYISVLDNGSGMPEDVVTTIKNGVAITSGKKNGHGIGFSQIHDMLRNNFGEINIYSSSKPINHGTTIELVFPKMGVTNWIATEINLAIGDTIVILDNDITMHKVWAIKLQNILEKIPNIKLRYFSSVSEFTRFMDNLSVAEKQEICLFSKYELGAPNGLEVLEQYKAKSSILITQDVPSAKVRKIAVQNRVKILPEELIVAFSCKVIQRKNSDELVNVHMIFVDDEKLVTEAIVREYYNHLLVDTYSNPFEFLDKADMYAKDTKIILDNYYYAEDGSCYDIDGIIIAKQLHDKGFRSLFLLSGEKFDTPDYLQLILKSDKESIRNLDKL